LIAHSAHNGVDIIKTWIALGREGLLQTLAGHADLFGHAGKPFDAGDYPQRREQRGRIAILGVLSKDLVDEIINLFGMLGKILNADLI